MIGQRPISDAVIRTVVAMNSVVCRPPVFVGTGVPLRRMRRTAPRCTTETSANVAVYCKDRSADATPSDHRHDGHHHNHCRQDCPHHTDAAVQVRAPRRHQRRRTLSATRTGRHDQAVQVDDSWQGGCAEPPLQRTGSRNRQKQGAAAVTARPVENCAVAAPRISQRHGRVKLRGLKPWTTRSGISMRRS